MSALYPLCLLTAFVGTEKTRPLHGFFAIFCLNWSNPCSQGQTANPWKLDFLSITPVSCLPDETGQYYSQEAPKAIAAVF